MPSTTVAEHKKQLRSAIRAQMKSLSPQVCREEDEVLFARFLALPQVEGAGTILIYHGMGAEPDTARLIAPLLARGKRVALPRCLPGREMEARSVTGAEQLVRHRFGMLEPGEDCPAVDRGALDLILVPGLAFDRQCRRLGQGGGFYDRWLAGFSGFTAALCRAPLLLERLPAEGHDLPVALVLTEEGLYGPSAPLTAQSGA